MEKEPREERVSEMSEEMRKVEEECREKMIEFCSSFWWIKMKVDNEEGSMEEEGVIFLQNQESPEILVSFLLYAVIVVRKN